MQSSQKMFTPGPESIGQSFPSATHLSYQIGGITFGLHAEGDLLLTPERELAAFAVAPGSGDVHLQVSWA